MFSHLIRDLYQKKKVCVVLFSNQERDIHISEVGCLGAVVMLFVT
jgi:hypothetical protein